MVKTILTLLVFLVVYVVVTESWRSWKISRELNRLDKAKREGKGLDIRVEAVLTEDMNTKIKDELKEM